MTIRCACLFAFLLASVFRSYAQQQERQTVDIVSGSLHLKAFQWKPKGPGPFAAVLFNHGSGGADSAHTAGMPITEGAEKLAPIFVKHGYGFLYPFRRGQGLSANQAPFMQDVLQRDELIGTTQQQPNGFREDRTGSLSRPKMANCVTVNTATSHPATVKT